MKMEISKNRKLTQNHEEIQAHLLVGFKESYISVIENPLHLILQAHLYIEHLIERFIISELPKGKIIIEQGHLSFKQKVLLASTFSIFEEQVIDSILKLNKLRNNLAHKFNHVITDDEIELIGRPLGKDYSLIQKDSEGDSFHKLKSIIIFITGGIAAELYVSENCVEDK